MAPPLRPFTEAEREYLEQGLHSENASHRIKCEILLESAKGSSSAEIFDRVNCGGIATIRQTVFEFNAKGTEWLQSLNKPLGSRLILQDDDLVDDEDEDD